MKRANKLIHTWLLPKTNRIKLLQMKSKNQTEFLRIKYYSVCVFWQVITLLWISGHLHNATVLRTVDLHLFNAYFGSFLSIWISFILRVMGIICVVFLLFRLASCKEPCKRWRSPPYVDVFNCEKNCRFAIIIEKMMRIFVQCKTPLNSFET